MYYPSIKVYTQMATKIIIGFCAWIPFLLVATFVFIPFMLLWCYRFLVTVILRRLFRMDLIEPMILPEVGFATDSIWTKPKTAVAFIHVLDGPLELENLRARLLRVIGPKVIANGESLTTYERLTSSYPTTWLGFSFWTKLTIPFDINNHVKIYSSKSIDEKILNIDEIVQNWFGSAFKKNCPLWDIILISDFRDDAGMRKSVLGFRIHHLIGDGYSMLGFLEKIFDKGLTGTPQVFPNPQPMTPGGRLKMWFYMPLTQGKKLAELFFHSDYFSTMKSDCEISYSKTAIDLSEFLLIRKKLSEALGGVPVPFATAILFVFGAAMKKTLLWSSIITSAKPSRCFQSLKIGISMPKSTPHPRERFCNHWSYGALDVPLIEKSPLKRLEEMVSNISGINSSIAFEMNATWDAMIYSQLPQFAFNSMATYVRGTTIGMTNLPGPGYPVQICNSKVLEKYLMVGLQTKNTSFMLGCFSYNNQLTISIIGNERVFSKEFGQKLLEYFTEEIKNLLEDGITINEPMNHDTE